MMEYYRYLKYKHNTHCIRQDLDTKRHHNLPEYLMLDDVVITDSSGTQRVTNNNGVSQTSVVKPF